MASAHGPGNVRCDVVVGILQGEGRRSCPFGMAPPLGPPWARTFRARKDS